LVAYRQDSPDAAPVLAPGQVLPSPCRNCGRPADVIEIVEVVVRDREEARRFLAESDEGPKPA
jgi:hypothetical protein